MPTPNNEHVTTTSDELTMPEISFSVTLPQLRLLPVPQFDFSSLIESHRNIDLRLREFERENFARTLEESQRRQQQEFEEFHRSLVINDPIYRLFTNSLFAHRGFQEQTSTRNNFFDNGPHQAAAPSTNCRPQQTVNEQRLQDYITALKELLSETEMAKENERIESRLCDLRCVMSLELPDTPINILGERNVYERSQLKHWLEVNPENARRHPISREPVTNLDYNIDVGTQNEIEALLQSLEQRVTELTAARACRALGSTSP